MPEAQDLIRAALERAEARPPQGDPAARAAELIAMGRLREVCEIQALKAA